MFEFLKSRIFIKNLLWAIAIIALFFISIGWFLSGYTRHGKYIVLPNLLKSKLSIAENELTNLGLKYIIIDSAYDENSQPGCVITQNPYPGAHVKTGRNVYLKITSVAPPLVEMPNLIDKSLREAIIMIDNSGFKKGRVIEVPGQIPGYILAQLYKGNDIAPGVKIPKGSVIDVKIGSGNIPDSLKDMNNE